MPGKPGRVAGGLPGGHAAIAVHPAKVSPAAFSFDGSLYRSDDLAQTWRRIDHGIKAESTLMAVALHPEDPAQIYSVSRGGQVFGTQDAGDTWREYCLPSGVEDVYAVACG